MTLQEAIELATTKLASISDSAKLDAQLLVCHTCNTDQTKLITHPEKQLSGKELTSFQSILTRRSQGEPLAYIKGKKEFWSLNFIVNEHVLIPRPETELLVEIALELISGKQTPQILDLGTGSGAIAIAIAKQRNDCIVVATDISQEALEVAKMNATKHKVSTNFIHSDWYENLANQKFDIIVCNPPYVAEDDPQLHQLVTQYEPNEAVISKNNGLQDLVRVISSAQKYLSLHGHLIVEHGFQQARVVEKLFKQYGFNHVVPYKDLADLNRVTTGTI